MPFKYACFINYCHSQGDLIKPVVEQLAKAFNDYLEPFFNFEEGHYVYYDQERLKPGYLFYEPIPLIEFPCYSALNLFGRAQWPEHSRG